MLGQFRRTCVMPRQRHPRCTPRVSPYHTRFERINFGHARLTQGREDAVRGCQAHTDPRGFESSVADVPRSLGQPRDKTQTFQFMSELCIKSPQLRHNQHRFNPSRASPKPLVSFKKSCPAGRLPLESSQAVRLLTHFGSVNRGSNPRAPAKQ